MPRSCTSRLAWLSQTLIAMASGRINQNYLLFFLSKYTLVLVNVLNKTTCKTLKESAVISMNVRIATIPTSEPTTACPPIREHRFAFSSPLKQPYYIRIKRIYTLRTAKETRGFVSAVTPKFALLCEATLLDSKSYKTFEPTTAEITQPILTNKP